MRVAGKLSRQEIIQIRRIVWAPHYRLNLFNNYTQRRLFPLMGVVGVGASVSVWLSQKTHIASAIISAVFGIGILCLANLLVRWHNVPAKLLNEINRTQPKFIDIDDEHLLLEQEDGTTRTVPWTLARGWRSSDDALVLDFSDKNLLPIPFGQLTSDQQQELQRIIQTQLGAPTSHT